MKVLIVDDSRAMRMLVLRSLRQAGLGEHEFQEAEDGAQALDAIQSFRPDVVLSDWNMPNVSGIDLLEQVNAAGVETVFGFVTSESTEEMASRARGAGAQFFVTKPFTAEDFQEALGSVLG